MNRDIREAADWFSSAISWANTSDGHLAYEQLNRDIRAAANTFSQAISWANTSTGHLAVEQYNRDVRAALNTFSGAVSWANTSEGHLAIERFNRELRAAAQAYYDYAISWANTTDGHLALQEYNRQLRAAAQALLCSIPNYDTTQTEIADGHYGQGGLPTVVPVNNDTWYDNGYRNGEDTKTRTPPYGTNDNVYPPVSTEPDPEPAGVSKYEANIFKKDLEELQTTVNNSTQNTTAAITALKTSVEKTLDENTIKLSSDDVLRLPKGLIVPKTKSKALQLYPVTEVPIDPQAGEIYYNKDTAAICVWLEDPNDASYSAWEMVAGLPGAYCPE